MIPQRDKPIVLVADDDIATRYVLVSALDHEGFAVIEAENGAEAVESFEKSRPDVVLMDVEMPGQTDGYQACETIRNCDGGSDLPIVMVTGHDDSESINRAYEVGATDFISKPINWSLIGHRLRYILRGARNYQALGTSEAENRALIAAIPDSIFIVDSDGTITKHLRGSGVYSSHPSAELTGKEIACVMPVGLTGKISACIKFVLSTFQNTTIEYALTDSRQNSPWYESRFVYHGDQKVLVIVRDITERKNAERRIHSLAYYDALTNLPNRPLFKERLDQELERTKSSDETIAVFNIDLNRFKRINDTLGTTTGDAVLVQISNRLSEYADNICHDQVIGAGKPGHCLACFGGNEFALLLTGLPDSTDYSLIGTQLLSIVASPVTVMGHEIVVTGSLGIAKYPEHGKSVEVLLKNAESARGEAKRRGGNSCKLYRSTMNARDPACLDLENELRRALENDELSMYYQSKFSVNTLEPRGAEALLRWFHPEKGEISPSTFIPIAEESGLISELGEWVANKVCEQISAWHYFGYSPGPIAINVSGKDFGLGDPVRILTDAIRKAEIPASSLELEITETVIMSDIRSVMLALHALREEGFSLAVDDFGTGYSSLRYLQKFPVDVLKIDSSFVDEVEKNTDSRSICTAIIAMARSLGLKVVAEGVETQWQLDFLRRQGCDSAQGFMLSKPLSPDAFVEQFNSSNPIDTGAKVIHLISQSER
ncbi:MAG: EAL domain-containing protein [Woeseiaceae bacterium]